MTILNNDSDFLNNEIYRNIDPYLILIKSYENDIKIDMGHIILLAILLDVEKKYRELINKEGKLIARKKMEDAGIFVKGTDYVSGEYLKKKIGRESRGAVHSRLQDLKKLGFKIVSKPGRCGGYRIVEVPQWFNQKSF